MLVSLEEAREYLRIDEDDTSNDDVILSSLETCHPWKRPRRCAWIWPAARKRMPKRIPSCSMKPSSMPPPFCTSIGKKPIIPAC